MVVIISVTIGIFGGVFAVAVMNGAIEQRVDAALNEEISHIHIHNPGFRDNFDIQLTIPGLEQVTEAARSVEGIEAFSSRLVVSGMANTASKSSGVLIQGIEPDEEKGVLRLYQTTLDETGTYLGEQERKNLAYIGQDLAKDLNIIRYMINEAILDSLRQKEVPADVLEKLVPFTGIRFKSEKAFKKEMKSALSLKEQQAYGKVIREEAWSFRSRSKLTLTFLDRDQVQTGAVFRIAGIYDIKNSIVESSQVFVMKEDLLRLTGLNENQAHQVIIRIKDLDQTDPIAMSLKEKFPALEVRTWGEIDPYISMLTGMVQKFYTVFMVVILAALAFGIVNTMLMVVLERTKELGMLTAIGMNKKRVFSMIMLESIFLSLVGGVVGMVVSRLLIAFTAANGINFASYEEGFEALGYSAHIYPVISPAFFFVVTVLIIITGVLSSIYPALKALKLDPADALRTE